MKDISRRLLWAAVLIGTVMAGPWAWGQDDDEPVENAVVQAPQFAFTLSDQQFDMWAFGNRGNAESVRSMFDGLLSRKTLSVNRLCGLTRAQSKKLELAGRGDVKRYFDRFEEKREKHLGTIHDQDAFNEAIRDINSLQSALDIGLFGDGSLFEKTLATVVSEKQWAAYRQTLRERTLFVYRAKVELVAALLGNTLGLSTEQRQKIGALLLEETRPPKKYGNYDSYVVLYQAARLPEEKIRPMLHGFQWLALKRIFARALALEPMLRQNDVLPEAEKDQHSADDAMPVRAARKGFIGK